MSPTLSPVSSPVLASLSPSRAPLPRCVMCVCLPLQLPECPLLEQKRDKSSTVTKLFRVTLPSCLPSEAGPGVVMGQLHSGTWGTLKHTKAVPLPQTPVRLPADRVWWWVV